MKRYSNGFTLIELMVVVAIIGFLSAIILVSLTSARKKAYDAHMMYNVQQIRYQVESKFNSADYSVTLNGNYDGMANGGGFISSTIVDQLVADSLAGNAYLFAKTNSAPVTRYAIYGSMPSTGNTKYYCIGSDKSTSQFTSTVVASANLNTTNPICQ